MLIWQGSLSTRMLKMGTSNGIQAIFRLLYLFRSIIDARVPLHFNNNGHNINWFYSNKRTINAHPLGRCAVFSIFISISIIYLLNFDCDNRTQNHSVQYLFVLLLLCYAICPACSLLFGVWVSASSFFLHSLHQSNGNWLFVFVHVFSAGPTGENRINYEKEMK